MEEGTKKQDCLRPLCGSQTTNPSPDETLHRNRQQNNNTTTAGHCRKHVVTTDFPPRGRLSQPPRARTQGYGGHSVGETPGPIPNPEAKTHSADGTAPGRVWESRSPPDNHYSQAPTHSVGACAI